MREGGEGGEGEKNVSSAMGLILIDYLTTRKPLVAS